MQRILSVEASRNGNLTSEFVTKRLCCSFILTIAFFAIIAGFLLGRFAAEKRNQQIKLELMDVRAKLRILDDNLMGFLVRMSASNCIGILSLNNSNNSNSSNNISQTMTTTATTSRRIIDCEHFQNHHHHHRDDNDNNGTMSVRGYDQRNDDDSSSRSTINTLNILNKCFNNE